MTGADSSRTLREMNVRLLPEVPDRPRPRREEGGIARLAKLRVEATRPRRMGRRGRAEGVSDIIVRFLRLVGSKCVANLPLWAVWWVGQAWLRNGSILVTFERWKRFHGF
jgi:hypothetical protein